MSNERHVEFVPSLCFSIWGVSSLLSLPVPISLDYAKLQASMQVKVIT